MKRLVLLVSFFALMGIGCQSIKFDRYPGTPMAEFPENIRGKYVSGGKLANDTVTVWISKDSYTIYDNHQTSVNFLDSNHVYSMYKNNYFLFAKEEGYWLGFHITKNKKGIGALQIAVPTKGNIDERRKAVGKYFSDVKCDDNTKILDMITCTAKMDENSLLKYVKKNKRNTIKLIQVKE